jgi:hypothetical protein
MGTYTHINLADQSSEIELLPAPPTVKTNGKPKVAKAKETELRRLDAVWGELPEDIKGRILELAGGGNVTPNSSSTSPNVHPKNARSSNSGTT